jgi:hypothetical protein
MSENFTYTLLVAIFSSLGRIEVVHAVAGNPLAYIGDMIGKVRK